MIFLIGKTTGLITMKPITVDSTQVGEFSIPDAVRHYHNNGHGRRTRNVPLERRQIIAWDGEGMNLSGGDKPQHYVVFGCSVESDSPMVSPDLISADILEYICDVGERFPSSVHIGYGF